MTSFAGSPPRMRGKAPAVRTLVAVALDHPRVCGEKAAAEVAMSEMRGSPPRMRGKVACGKAHRPSGRITPAYAGKSAPFSPAEPVGPDHPRVCGEKNHCCLALLSALGSPPRMRGKEVFSLRLGLSRRITPAYAGKRCRASARCPCGGDHPRVCGEKGQGIRSPSGQTGSPPRMRGKEILNDLISSGKGITPAYAGKSTRQTPSSRLRRDHPRVCGEKRLAPLR